MIDKKGLNVDIPPPSDKTLKIKDKFWIVPGIIWLILLIIPNILLALILALIRRLFTTGKSLEGQVALVTGAGRGLGKGVALALAQEGCKVAVVDINIDNAKATAKEICASGRDAKAYCTNVANVQEVRALREAVTKDFGPVDLLVNNAALIYFDSIENYTEEAILGIVNVNLISHFWMVQEFLPSMRERNSGHIVAMNSSSALAGLANNSVYVATRFGVRGFMESLRDELKANPDNKIKTTSIYPYFTNTSAHYVNHWDLRIPPLSTENVVKATIAGIKRDDTIVPMPWILYYTLHLRWLVPRYVFDLSHKIIYARIIVPSKEVKEQLPQTSIMKYLARERNLQ